VAGTQVNDCRPGQPRIVGNFEIEPIERIVVHVEKAFGGLAGVAFKEPIAVVIRSPAGTWRVELPLDTPGDTQAPRRAQRQL
jgi:hypothetical protein